MERRMSMRTLPQSARTRWLLPAASVVAVVAVVVAVVVVGSAVHGVNDPSHPPILHLVNVAGGSPGLPAQSAAGFADKTGAPGSRGSGWRLEGTLPAGPSSGRVHLLPAGAATRAFVGSLARALGMSGEPQHLTAGWYLVSGTTELSVSELAGRHWIYSNHGCIAGPVLDPQVGADCTVARSAPPIEVAPSLSLSRRTSPEMWPARSSRRSGSTRTPRGSLPQGVAGASSSAPRLQVPPCSHSRRRSLWTSKGRSWTPPAGWRRRPLARRTP